MDRYESYRELSQTNIKQLLDQFALTGLQYRQIISGVSDILTQIDNSSINKISSQLDILRQLKPIQFDAGIKISDMIAKNSSFSEINTKLISDEFASIYKGIKIADIAQISLHHQLQYSEIFKSFQQYKYLDKSFYSSFLNFSISYSNLTASAKEIILEKPRSARVVSELSALEILNSVEVLETVSGKEINREENQIEDEIEEEKESFKNDFFEKAEGIEKLLINIGSPDLVPMWQGAKSALNSTDNPDYARHCAVSLRELFTHVIHRLSPDEEIKKWNDDKEFLHNGKPTRRARLLYICRSVNHDMFSDFIAKDIDAILEIVKLFQRGTHEVTIPFTHKQLIALQTRIESTINFLIEIWQLNE